MTVAEIEALTAHLTAQNVMTSKAVCACAQQTFGHLYTPNAMTKMLRSIGFSYKKPKRFPAKADRAAQETFLHDVLEPLVAEASEATP